MIPEVELISLDDLSKIQAYYESEAPEELAPGEIIPEDSVEESSLFKVSPNKFLPALRLITCVKIDSANHRLWVADGTEKALWVFTPRGVPLETHSTRETEVVDICVTTDGFQCTLTDRVSE